MNISETNINIYRFALCPKIPNSPSVASWTKHTANFPEDLQRLCEIIH